MDPAEPMPLDAAQFDDADMDETFEDKVGEVKDITPDGGLKKKILEAGSGWERPEKGDSVTVHYTGTLASDGSKFDSSVDRGEPFVFTLGQGSVIKGWDLGVATMKKGEKAVLTCRADYAYGDSGSPPKIPGGATLDFEVELLSWKSVKDIAGDGGVIKTVVEESSEWKRPSANDEVALTYSIKVKGADKAASEAAGAVFDLSKGAPLGLKGLEVAVMSMKKGEAAHLVLTPDYGFGAAGSEGVPPGSALEVDVKLDAIHEVTLVAPGVVKKTLEESAEWRTAAEGAKVALAYTAALPDGTLFDEAVAGSELRITVDDEMVPEGVDLALMKMKKGERALITINDAKLAFGAAGHKGRLAAVPADAAPLTYDVTLVELDNPKDKWEMSGEEKAEAAAAAKDKGNAAYKAGKLERAARLYGRAKELVGDDEAGLDREKDGPEVRAQLKDIRKSVLLNLAAVELKRGSFREAQRHTSKVLETDPSNVKALYRRAQALVGLQELLEAERDVKVALDMEPASADLAALSKRIKLLIKQLNKKEAGLYKSMFKALGKGGGAKESDAVAAAQQDAAAGGDQAAAAAPMEEGGGGAAAAQPEAVAAA
ncbi:MAG: hypothetical protein J3K34DRAFT_421882 [Monoraphidium minutum]|nr:MAG: hypothetical protein J3K34DRAFT_421882 [Monoraphidium minutum]